MGRSSGRHQALCSEVTRRTGHNVLKTGAGICYRGNRKHLQGVPNVLLPVPNNEPDDTDILFEDPGEVLPPNDPGDAVDLPVDVSAELNKSAVYTRCGRAGKI